MKAVVLAGGMGTRLRPLTYTLPKPMVLVGEKPLLHHTVEALVEADFDEVIITTNFLAGVIRDYFNQVDFGIPVHCIEETTAMGTAGCVKNVENLLTDTFVVLPGDSISSIDLKALLLFHLEKKATATLALTSVSNPSEYGIVELDEWGRIVRFLEKPKPEECFSNLANTGYYVFNPKVLGYIPAQEPYDFSFGLFPQLLKEKEELYGWVAAAYWVDIGRVEKYLAGTEWFLGRHQEPTILGEAQIDRDCHLEGPVIIDKGTTIKKGATIGPFTVLANNVTVDVDAYITGSIVYQDTVIGPRCQIHHCVIGDDVLIEEGTKIEKNVIVGKGCHLAKRVYLKTNSKVGPFFDVPPVTTIEGVASAFVEKGTTMQSFIEQNPELLHLNSEEFKVFGLLAEMGELPAKSLSALSKIPYSQIHQVLYRLQQEGLVVSYGDAPKLFTLRYEHPELLKFKWKASP